MAAAGLLEPEPAVILQVVLVRPSFRSHPTLPTRTRELSIRRALTLSFSVIIVVLAASLIVLAAVERTKSRADLAEALLEETLAQAHRDLDNLFAPVRRQLAIDWHTTRMGGVPRYDARRHARHFLPALHELPMVGSMMVADTAGHQLLLMRYDATVLNSRLLRDRTDLPPPSGRSTQVFTRDFRPAVRGEVSSWRLWDSTLTRPDAEWTVPLPGYEPRERAWYTQAVERFRNASVDARHGPRPQDFVVWSDVYTFFTTREAGVSASFAAREPSGELVIVAYDVLLDEVGRYTRSQAPTPHASVLVVSDSGWVVGAPRASAGQRETIPALTSVDSLGDPLLSQWAAAWRATERGGTTTARARIDGAEWWFGAHPFDLGADRRLWIGVAVPEADLLARATSGELTIALVSVLVLLVGLGAANWLSAKVARPLAELAEQTDRIARLDLETQAPPVSRIREVKQLGSAIQQVREALQENFAERDRTAEALQESEWRLLQSQKLEAVGQLAGGVAHDFNNLLTAIRGYTGLLQDRLRGNHDAIADLMEIDAAAERATEVTGRLLSFSRRQHVEARAVDVNETVVAATNLLGHLVGERVTLKTDLTEGLPHVVIDPGQLHQVLVNLIINARDAMPAGGTVTLATGCLRGEPAGVFIAVTDTGVGMSDEVRERAFEPFFTTKQTGRGTGLGLASCWGIVRGAGGTIEITSTPGDGTTVRIEFPEAVITAAPPRRTTPHPIRGARGELVMVVEDEEQIRELAERVLLRAGYRVLSAQNGQQALDLAAGQSAPIALTLTDVVMPVMGGPELARALRHRTPDARIIYMTGYADSDAFGPDGGPDSGLPVLRKPFTPHGLLRAVRGALDGVSV